MLKNQKGITLVALIITIIVLLILATVAINIVLNDGLFSKSENAVKKHQEAEIAENESLTNVENKMNEYLDKFTSP